MFKFGRNWKRYLLLIDDKRIDTAKRSLKEYLAVETLSGKTFLDAGCGSGLFSLAARQLGAKALSFDIDKDSVECAKQLKMK
ncbi:MAG: 50S ribosomal protein L11 methyltransferase, partial [Candidatus Margulisiibacteriota bacterium]